ncbi:sucrase-isomaltase, intestinal-like [Oppia nitens]|uniref:sucrase-isomaltase, intestinal-like n=1 Tax=Oppia nitens TaxID=1686743 RepID=UPI0023DAC3B5|nr:sucrase-isomaltase, intestinal-like [Oppia nitens]
MPQIEKLKLQVTYLTDNIVRFRITDPANKRYEVPVQHTFPLLMERRAAIVDENSTKYAIELNEKSNNFDFAVVRKDTKTRLIDTSVGGLIFADQLLQIATYLPTKNIYGFGENMHRQLKNDINYKTWNLFSRGEPPEKDIINLYGVHPYYTGLEKDGKSHGVLFLSSNAMEYTLMPEPALSLKSLGGVFDFFVFVGDNPEHVQQLYAQLIGRPFLPPFWSLGYQLTRYGFKNTENVRQMYERNVAANIPLDVAYMDIDYMDKFEDFTYDKDNFKGLPELISTLKTKYNIHTTLMLDPAIEANNTKYYPFLDGYNQDVFIKYSPSIPVSERNNPLNVPIDKDYFYGVVWPRGPAAFPDFFKNRTAVWWQKWMNDMYTTLDLKFDAIWIDMNEPYNFGPDASDPETYCPENKYDMPSIRIQSIYGNGNVTHLGQKTVCMCTVQGENDEYLNYDVHSLYGYSESVVTQKAVRAITGKRSFILSRSTYVSSGRYTAHWLGDNTSDWPFMSDSIVGILEFNLFGIPFIGADTCGFFHNATAQLCRRWSQLGAFYPFSRNHAEIHAQDQDPAVWTSRGNPEVTEAARNSLNHRYTLLPYLYTLFYRAHTIGQTVARPVFHEFANDTNTYAIDKQFMWGRSVLISPILEENKSAVTAYLPPSDNWFESWPQITKVPKTGFLNITDKKYETGPPPVHFRGGSIIPMSAVSKHNNTVTVRQAPINLIVLPVGNNNNTFLATGDLFWDDGDSIDTVEKNLYNYWEFQLLPNCTVFINPMKKGYSSSPVIKEIQVYDTNGSAIKATVDGKAIDARQEPSGYTRLAVNIDLNAKEPSYKWIVSWGKSDNKCNLN